MSKKNKKNEAKVEAAGMKVVCNDPGSLPIRDANLAERLRAHPVNAGKSYVQGRFPLNLTVTGRMGKNNGTEVIPGEVVTFSVETVWVSGGGKKSRDLLQVFPANPHGEFLKGETYEVSVSVGEEQAAA